jgi:hypothetical protein
VYHDPFGQPHVVPGGSGGFGGAIVNESNLALTNCTFAGNNSGSGGQGVTGSGAVGGNGGNGGAIFNGRPGPNGGCFLVACTLSGNCAGSGGRGGTNSPPVYGPTAGTNGTGGGMWSPPQCQGCTQAPVRLSNTLIAGNGSQDTGPEVAGAYLSLGHNLVGRIDASSTIGLTNGVKFDRVGSFSVPLDPRLGPLADNGGPTPTMALLHGSPALNAGDDRLIGPAFRVMMDQRGFQRRSGGHVDIGALEFQSGGSKPPLVMANRSATSAFSFNFTDTNNPAATFSVLSTTNLFLPVGVWTLIGSPTQIGSGQFEFSAPQSAGEPQRFYRVSSP